MKNRIRLTEGQLHRVIKESVKRVLKESNNTEIAELLNKTSWDLERILDFLNATAEGLEYAEKTQYYKFYEKTANFARFLDEMHNYFDKDGLAINSSH